MIGKGMLLCEEHPHTLESWNNLIELYEASGKPEKAKEWLKKAVGCRKEILDPKVKETEGR